MKILTIQLNKVWDGGYTGLLLDCLYSLWSGATGNSTWPQKNMRCSLRMFTETSIIGAKKLSAALPVFSPLLAHVSRLQTDFPQAPVRRGAGYLVVVSRWNVTSGGKQPATWTAGHTVCFMLPLHCSSDGNVVFRHHLLFKKANVRAYGGAAAGRLWVLISLFVGWDLLPWSLHVLAMPKSVSFGLFGFPLLSKNLHIEINVTVHWEWM